MDQEVVQCRVVIAKDTEKEVRCMNNAIITVEISEGEEDVPLVSPLCEEHKEKYLSGKSIVVVDQSGMLWLIGSHITV